MNFSASSNHAPVETHHEKCFYRKTEVNNRGILIPVSSAEAWGALLGLSLCRPKFKIKFIYIYLSNNSKAALLLWFDLFNGYVRFYHVLAW